MKSLPRVVALVALVLPAGIDSELAPDTALDAPPVFAALNAEMSFMPNCAFTKACPSRTHLRVRSNGSVFWAAIDGMTESDTSDANFRKVAGLANPSCVSFESILYPGHFLRHRGPNAELIVNRGTFWDFNFNSDTTFCPSGYQFEAFNSPGWYLRKSGASLVLWQLTSSTTAATYDTVILEAGRATIGMVSESLGLTQHAGSPDWIWESRGPCTGLTPPFQQPRISCTQPGIFLTDLPLWNNPTQFRPIFHCSPSFSWFGTSPWIKMYKRGDLAANFHKIETGYGICF